MLFSLHYFLFFYYYQLGLIEINEHVKFTSINLSSLHSVDPVYLMHNVN